MKSLTAFDDHGQPVFRWPTGNLKKIGGRRKNLKKFSRKRAQCVFRPVRWPLRPFRLAISIEKRPSLVLGEEHRRPSAGSGPSPTPALPEKIGCRARPRPRPIKMASLRSKAAFFLRLGRKSWGRQTERLRVTRALMANTNPHPACRLFVGKLDLFIQTWRDFCPRRVCLQKGWTPMVARKGPAKILGDAPVAPLIFGWASCV